MDPLTTEATYENGVLKLDQPLPLKDNERVRITVETAKTWVERTAGMMGWTGSAELAEQIALDPELDPNESG